MKIVANEFILPFVDGMSAHASHFVLLKEGRLFCVFFYGSGEGHDDVRIYGCFREPDCSWSKPTPVSEDDGIPHWNPVLLRKKDGSIILFYKVGKTIADWITEYRVSVDECVSWSEPRELVAGDRSGGRGPVRNKAIYLRDGSIIAPASTEVDEWKCFFDRSTDGGLTWKRTRDLRVFDEEYTEELKGRGIIQPTVWESSSGIHALLRSSEGKIFRTDSDNGIDWCDPYATEMPNNNSGIDTVRLDDGRIILACNPIGDNWGSRTPLSLFISSDDGRSFKLLTHLITMKGKFAYPAMLCSDGLLHITYTWKRKTIAYMCLSEL